jgi:hypothetical protein
MGWEFVSSTPPPERLRGPPSLLSNGYQGTLSPEVKRPGHEADYSPPFGAEVKNAWSYTFAPPIHFDGVVLSYSTGTTLPLPVTVPARLQKCHTVTLHLWETIQ